MCEYDPHQHHRRSIRLPDWDYTSPAYYFVTICTYKRQLIFKNDIFHEIAANALLHIPKQAHAQHVRLDEWVVMPNHEHIIFNFIDYPEQKAVLSTADGLQNAPVGSLGVVVGRYKTAVTTRINKLRHTPGARLWHRGFYERIIRNERQLQATRQYIRNNPLRWAEDRENLDALLIKTTYRGGRAVKGTN